ncbi:hypothetical protein HDG38_000675 [Paraburkholderia sp. WSM4177]|nr:hypothetical protein [Paraburkholderia sp. WSM4177]MBB5483112.1 hypothetical protein [Paraburkholderia sp. WSM4180]
MRVRIVVGPKWEAANESPVVDGPHEATGASMLLVQALYIGLGALCPNCALILYAFLRNT